MYLLADGLWQGVHTVDETVFPLSIVSPTAQAALRTIVGEVVGGKHGHRHPFAEWTGVWLLFQHGQVAYLEGDGPGVFATFFCADLSVDILQGMTDGHVLRSLEAVGGFSDADVIVRLRAETWKLYQVVVALDSPFVGDGDGIDGWGVVEVHLIIVDSQEGRVLSLLQFALLQSPDDASSPICHLPLETRQSVVLAA